MSTRFDEPFWIGDRYFSEDDISLIQETLRRFRQLSRNEMAATLCENLNWVAPNGKLRVDACRDMLNQIDACGWMPVPPARVQTKPMRHSEKQGTPLPPANLAESLRSIQPITLEPVSPLDRPVWVATMATYHPLGYQRAFGARQQYWIVSHAGPEPRRLGGLLFAASAQRLAPRDTWIGWDPHTRAQFRARIVNNSRFLILPGVEVMHLASHVLGIAARQIRHDWKVRYGFEPVLLETFVEQPWSGTCYAAANWQNLGMTQGRGRNDPNRDVALARKAVWVYPLVRRWRTALIAPWPHHHAEEDDL